MIKFSLGKTVMSHGVAEHLKENNIDQGELSKLVYRHRCGDWGDIPIEDKEVNEESLKNGARLLSSYQLGVENVWVITEADRSVTTVLFPSEY